MIITVDAVTKESRVYQGQQQWGVKLPNGEWVTLICGFRPSKGQQFDVAMTERTGNNGRVFKTATIIAPAGQPPQQQAKPAPTQPTAPAQMPLRQDTKIKWDDWAIIIRSAWDVAVGAGMPPAEAVAVVNTTLIAFSNGKLETPGPVSGEVLNGDDPDSVPW